METVYIVKGGPVEQYQIDGQTYSPDALGKTEWQFSDGPVGRRGSSADYVDLQRGLEAHRDFAFNIDEADFTPSERAIFDAFLLRERA